VGDGIDLYLSQGTEESVAVSASKDEYMDRLKTEVEDGVLKIYYDRGSLNNLVIFTRFIFQLFLRQHIKLQEI
jgi:hypothetical protein